jgi:hypothetical protein
LRWSAEERTITTGENHEIKLAKRHRWTFAVIGKKKHANRDTITSSLLLIVSEGSRAL